MPEPDAFACFRKFVLQAMPRYFDARITGACQGCYLAMATLQHTDIELYTRIVSMRDYDPCLLNERVLSLLCKHKPFLQVRRLWDFFMAFGFGLVPVAVAATIVANHAAPDCFSFKGEPIDARTITDLTLALASRLPPDMLRAIHRHPWDTTAAAKYADQFKRP